MRAWTIIVCFCLSLTVVSLSTVADDYSEMRGTLELCEVCHGKTAAPADDTYPILAGQELYYLYVQLKDFKSGHRTNEFMAPVVAELDKAQLMALAKFYSEQAWPNIGFDGNATQKNKGEMAANAGQCVACHLSSYMGNSRIPRLAGQYPRYLIKTMLDMKSKARNNAPSKSSLMSTFSEVEIGALAEYLGSM